jgi:hypothetical protein
MWWFLRNGKLFCSAYCSDKCFGHERPRGLEKTFGKKKPGNLIRKTREW